MLVYQSSDSRFFFIRSMTLLALGSWLDSETWHIFSPIEWKWQFLFIYSFIFFFLYFFLFYLFLILHSTQSFPSSQTPPHLPIHSSSAVSLQIQAGQRYQSANGYQASVRPGTPSSTKVEWGNPARRNGLQKQATQSETSPALTARRTTWRPSYIAVTYMQRA